eukprot:scaffold40589_cov59-Phaeocystis_antarctica.AAC.1
MRSREDETLSMHRCSRRADVACWHVRVLRNTPTLARGGTADTAHWRDSGQLETIHISETRDGTARGAEPKIPRETGATCAPRGHAYNPAHGRRETAARFEDVLAHVTFTGAGSKGSRLIPLCGTRPEYPRSGRAPPPTNRPLLAFPSGRTVG